METQKQYHTRMDEIKGFDFRSPSQKARDKKWDAVCAMYKALREAYPGMKPHRIMAAMEDKFEMTWVGIKHILVSRGLYEVRNRKNDNQN